LLYTSEISEEDLDCMWTGAHKAPALKLFSPFTVTCKNPFKIAFGDRIFALLNHFLTVCAVNAQTC